MPRQPNPEREAFCEWLNDYQDMIKSSPWGIIDNLMKKYKEHNSSFTFKNKHQVSEWLRYYRQTHKLYIERLSHPYIRHSTYKSNYDDVAKGKECLVVASQSISEKNKSQ